MRTFIINAVLSKLYQPLIVDLVSTRQLLETYRRRGVLDCSKHRELRGRRRGPRSLDETCCGPPRVSQIAAGPFSSSARHGVPTRNRAWRVETARRRAPARLLFDAASAPRRFPCAGKRRRAFCTASKSLYSLAGFTVLEFPRTHRTRQYPSFTVTRRKLARAPLLFSYEVSFESQKTLTVEHK